ncbi:MAG: leucine/isoleucine/valine transporter permease subunit [Anaerolineae bacterium]|nr:leucine/isoleucine/valine transporter permease subunit [Anaerolineae bacterium]
MQKRIRFSWAAPSPPDLAATDQVLPFAWSIPVLSGVIGGSIAVFLSLLGMVEVSSGRDIISDVLSMGQVLVLLPLIYATYRSVNQTALLACVDQDKKRIAPWLFLAGALAGLVSCALLALLVLIGTTVDLQAFFVRASPTLYDLLTLGMGVPAGLLVLLAIGALVGILLAAVSLLPGQLRRSIVLGMVLIPVVAILHSTLFSGSGLSLLAAVIILLLVGGASYLWSSSQDTVKERVADLSPARQRNMRLGAWVAAGLIVLALPLLGAYPADILDMIGLYALMGLGLNIVVGFAGLLDLGYVAFFALGAYTLGVLTSPEILWTGVTLTFWQALPFAVGVSTLAGIILGVPVLGMRGDYLAIVTLGFGEIIRLVFLSDWLKPYIGGSNGITRIAKPAIGPIVLNNQQGLFYPILVGCLVVAFISLRSKNSRLGRAWMAVREDEDVAQAMGIDLVRTKLLAFATGAAFAGLAGAFFATKLTSIYPHSFHLLVSINVLCVVIVGGMGSIPGVVVGSLALVGLPEVLREFSEYRLLMYGAALVLMMLNRPEGLLPEARRRLELHEADEELEDYAAAELETLPATAAAANPVPPGGLTESGDQ